MSGKANLVYVLYEDQRGPRKAFGLHELVLSCVVDQLGADRWSLGRRLVARPMKGVDKVLHEVCWNEDEFDALTAAGAHVFALVDNDRVRRHAGLEVGASDEEVKAKIMARCPDPSALTVVLLERNTETVINAVGECAKALGKDRYGDVAQAIDKNMEARDAVLNRAAFDDTALRICVENNVPTFGELIRGVVAVLLPFWWADRDSNPGPTD